MDKTSSSDATGEVVELPIHCTRCGGALEVECEDWRSDAPPLAQYFACPYCAKPNELTLPARLVWVSRRASSGTGQVH